MPPFLLGQLSDLHVRVGPGDDGAARALAAAVRAVAALDPPAQAVVVTGDLTDNGTAREYERVRELLAPLSVPVHVLPGNHDDPDELRASFGTPPRYATDCGPLRLIACDTTLRGRDDGHLDLAWVEAELAADRQAPTLLAMHHPPLLIGIHALDAIGLAAADRAGLAELVARNPQVRRIVAGHVHRTATGEIGGCAVLTCPSAWRQALLDLSEPGTLAMTDEPPGFALHVALDGAIVSHVQPIADGSA